MEATDVLRLVDSIHRDKGISKEIVFDSVETALLAAARKRQGPHGNLSVKINRITGNIEAYEDGLRLDPNSFGRICAQYAKQLITQRVREAERDVIFSDYEAKVDTLVAGTVQRFDKGSIIVNLGRTEGLILKQEQVYSEQYRPGDRIRSYVVRVQKKGPKVIIYLSRTHPNLVKELFTIEVPEIGDHIVEIKGIVREPGHRTKIAVHSNDSKVDPIGACVGVRGSRIRNIVEELFGEKIDIVRWHDAQDLYIRNALSPAEITSVELDREAQRARVIVPDDHLSLAIGKKGQNVRLTARLTHWHIDIMTEEQARKVREAEQQEVMRIPGLTPSIIERFLLGGLTSLRLIESKGSEHLQAMYGLPDSEADAIVNYAISRLEELEAARDQPEAAKPVQPLEQVAAPAPVASSDVAVAADAQPVLETASATPEQSSVSTETPVSVEQNPAADSVGQEPRP